MEMNEFKKMLSEYLHNHQNELFEDFRYIVSFPSIKSSPAPGAPFGPDSAKCLEACTCLFEKYGFEADRFPDLGYSLVYYGKKPELGDEYTAIMSHSDVVPVTPEDWTLTDDPFKMVDLGQNIVGRGVSDNKDAVIGTLYILRAIKENNIQFKHSVVAFIGSNEEAGMVDVRNFKKVQNPLPKVNLVPDAAFPVSFGERGSYHADVVSKDNLCDILSISGGQAYNIVLGNVDCTIKNVPGLLEYLQANPIEWLTYKCENDTIVLDAKGISAHGGKPFRGESAFARLSAYLSGFDGFSESDSKILKECAEMLSDCYGIKYGIDNKDPDMGNLTCCNGKVYMEDGKLGYTLDIRFGPQVEKEECKKKLISAVDSRGFTCKTTTGGSPFKIDPENPISKAFIEAYRELSGKADAKPFFMSGGTYSKVMQPDVLSFSTGVHLGGYVERLGLPSGHGGEHQADETLGKEELLSGLCILGSLMYKLDSAY